jgi:hypothetical protein
MSAVVWVMMGPEKGAGPDGARAMVKRTCQELTGMSSGRGRETSGMSRATIVRVEVLVIVRGERPCFDGSTPRARAPPAFQADLQTSLRPFVRTVIVQHARGSDQMRRGDDATETEDGIDVLWLRSGRCCPFSTVT